MKMVTKQKQHAEHLAFRVPPETMDRLDVLAEKMSGRFVSLGFTFSRSEAARAALIRGLPDVERDYGIDPPAEPPAPVSDQRTARKVTAKRAKPGKLAGGGK